MWRKHVNTLEREGVFCKHVLNKSRALNRILKKADNKNVTSLLGSALIIITLATHAKILRKYIHAFPWIEWQGMNGLKISLLCYYCEITYIMLLLLLKRCLHKSTIGLMQSTNNADVISSTYSNFDVNVVYGSVGVKSINIIDVECE
jgi:hypothetical protein